MATGAAYGQSNKDRGFVASIDTAGIHEDDPTVTRDVSANIFYFLDDQDHYVHDSEGRTLMTGLTRSVTVSVDLDTKRTTATVDQDFTWSAEDGAFKVVPYAEPERDDNGREIHRATDGGRILNCNGPVFAHPCVIDDVEHEIDDSSVPSYVAKVQAVHNELHVYEVQNYTVGIPVTITPTNDDVVETDEQICFRVRAAYLGSSYWRSVNTDCISLQDAIPDSTPVATASASHRYAAPGGLVKLTGAVADSKYAQHTLEWTQTGGTSVTVSDGSFVVPDSASHQQTFTFRLKATNGDGNHDTDDVSVVALTRPVAAAVARVEGGGVAYQGRYVDLDASYSLVVDSGDPIYAWSRVSGPITKSP